MRGLEAADAREAILTAAREQLLRFGSERVRLVDVARSLGVSHANLYRFFDSREAILDALVERMMDNEIADAERIARERRKATGRLESIVCGLSRTKRERCRSDAPEHELYRRALEHRPDLVASFEQRMTAIVERTLRDGVATGELTLRNPRAAAIVLRDAVTAFVHPATVATLGERDIDAAIKHVVRAVVAGLNAKPARARMSND